MSARLEAVGLTKAFESGRTSALAIDGIDLHVEPGEFVCLVGASGCGKSTLLNIIAGLVAPTSGSVTLDGWPIVGPGPDRGLVPQTYSLFPWRTVAQNVAFGLEIAGLDRAAIAERVRELLDVMQLGRWADARPSQLSGGMRQRVAIARSLATQPQVLLLDEPFGALDAHTRLLMQEFLVSLWRQTGTTVLMVTHDVDEALFLAQRVYVLSSHPGRVKRELALPFGDERSRELRRQPAFLDLRDAVQALLLTEAVEA